MNVERVDRRESLRLSVVRLGSIGAALMVVVVLTVTRSHAAFAASTANTANSVATGSVSLTDDDGGVAMFSVTGMTPVAPETRCLVVTYSGTISPADVQLFGSTTGSLDTYLDTTIEVGTGGTFSNCAGFTPSSTIYSGTLADFSATHSDFASSVAAFTAASTPTSRTIRVTLDVQDTPAAQGLSSTVSFNFETQA